VLERAADERGLSCHFLLDKRRRDLPTIDLALMAYHASEWNIASIGFELWSTAGPTPRRSRRTYSKARIDRR